MRSVGAIVWRGICRQAKPVRVVAEQEMGKQYYKTSLPCGPWWWSSGHHAILTLYSDDSSDNSFEELCTYVKKYENKQ